MNEKVPIRRLELRLTVDYRLVGDDLQAMADNLINLVDRATQDGLLTGYSTTTVANYNFAVVGCEFTEVMDLITKDENILTTEDLDEMIHDVASKHGSALNNSSLEEQVWFLCEQLGPAEVLRSLRTIVSMKHALAEED
jgi:hypothetical protein